MTLLHKFCVFVLQYGVHVSLSFSSHVNLDNVKNVFTQFFNYYD